MKNRSNRAAGDPARAARERRLAAALRANLRRRKAATKDELSAADPGAPPKGPDIAGGKGRRE